PARLVSPFARIPSRTRHQSADAADPASLNAEVGRQHSPRSGEAGRRRRPRRAETAERRRPARALECAGVIARPPLPPGPFLVVGLARSGVAAALALRSRGGEVVGCDAGPVSDDVRAELTSAGIPVHAPAEGVDLLASASTVVKSPGVPHQAPVIANAS